MSRATIGKRWPAPLGWSLALPFLRFALHVNRPALVLAAALLCVAACEDHVASQAAAPSPAPTVPKVHLGAGEPRVPQPFTLEQRLLDAVSRNDRATIERALARGATLQTKDDIGRSLALLAVLDAANLDLLRWLHEKGAALDEPDSGGRTPLSFAAANGQLEIVRYLLDNKAAVDRADVLQRTPLFHAALGGHREIIALLHDRGAKVNARDQFGDTPLIVACAKGDNATAELLLAKGADTSVKDQEGRTAAERAAPGTTACKGS